MTRARNSANLASHGNLFVDITNDRTGIGSVVPAQNLHVAGTAGFHADVTFTGDLYNTTWDRSDNSLKFSDSAKALFGTDSDLTIRHTGSTGYLENSTGFLFIHGNDIALRSQAQENYIVCDANAEVEIYYDGSKKLETTAYGTNTTGTAVNDGLVVAGVATVTTMNVTGVLTYDDVTSVDSVGIVTARAGVHCSTDGVANGVRIGAGQDLILQHNGTNSFIDNNTGDLYIQTTGSGDDILVESADDFTVKVAGSETAIQATGDGAVELYHNNVKKFETTSTAVKVTCSSGDVSVVTDSTGSALSLINPQNLNNNDVKFGSNYGHFSVFTGGLSGSEKFVVRHDANVRIPNDTGKLQIGAGQDLQIYHNGTDSVLLNSTGKLRHRSDIHIFKNNADSETLAKFNADGAVELYHNNVKKFETTTNGNSLQGAQQDLQGDVKFDNQTNAGMDLRWDESLNRLHFEQDNIKAVFGTGSDLEIYHDGSTNIINGLYHPIELRHGSEVHIRCVDDGTVKLYHNNSAKVETNSIGATITNVLYISGPAGNPGRLRLQEGGALCEIRGVRNTDTSSFLYFDTEISGTTATRLIIDGNGHLTPATDSTYDLGTSSKRWRYIYTDDASIANDLAVGSDIFLADSGRLYLGSSNDAYLYHDGSNTHFVNSTGNLLFRQAANSDVVIQTNAIDRFRIHEDGVVAIGQSSKSGTVGAGNLDIQGNATNCIIEMGNPFPSFSGGVVPEFRITATNSGHEVKFESVWGGDNALHKHMSFSGGITAFHKGTDSTEVARFNQNNLGINTTAPQRYLHIVGNDGATGATLGNSDTLLVLDNLGTNGPIIEFASASNSAGRIMFTDTDAINRGRLEYVHSDDSMRFNTAGAERLRISSSGDMGVGTNSPDRKLDVSGTGNVYGKFQSTNATGAGIEVKDTAERWLIQADGGVGPGLAFYDLGRTAYRFIMGNAGQLGIGGANYGSSGQVLTSGGASGAASWTTISSDLVSDTSPQLGADLDVNDFDIKNGNQIYEIVSNARHNFKSAGNTIMNINGNGVDFQHGNNTHADNVQSRFGTGNDLAIYHNGSNSFIQHSGTGDLYIDTQNNSADIYIRSKDNLELRTNSGAQTSVACVGNGGVILYTAGNQKFTTNHDGIQVTGRVEINDSNTRIEEGSTNALRLRTNSGYVDIGPMNTSFSHFVTDRPAFYFNVHSIFNGDVRPYVNNNSNLGSSAARWKTIFTMDLELSNEAKGGNDVDGTWGNWTLQEGEHDIFMINNRTGMKFKIKMEAVD